MKEELKMGGQGMAKDGLDYREMLQEVIGLGEE